MTETEGRKVAAEIADVIIEFMTGTGATDVLDLDEIVAPAIDAALERARVAAVAEAAWVCERKDAAFQQVRRRNPDRDLRVAAAIASEQRHSAKRIRALAGPSSYVAVRREDANRLLSLIDSSFHQEFLGWSEEKVEAFQVELKACLARFLAALDGGSDG